MSQEPRVVTPAPSRAQQPPASTSVLSLRARRCERPAQGERAGACCALCGGLGRCVGFSRIPVAEPVAAHRPSRPVLSARWCSLRQEFLGRARDGEGAESAKGLSCARMRQSSRPDRCQPGPRAKIQLRHESPWHGPRHIRRHAAPRGAVKGLSCCVLLYLYEGRGCRPPSFTYSL